jgi:poly(A) polymerase
MNALYCGADGTVYDPLGGYADLAARRVRFIGDSRERIREDFLRTLRFFRFLAEYGSADAPDPDGLTAAIAEKAGLSGLSGERVRAELLRLLAAPGAVEAAGAMHEAGLLEPLIGTAGDVGALRSLAAIEQALGYTPDPVLRLAALARAQPPEGSQQRLRLSGTETARLVHARVEDAAFEPQAPEHAAQAFIYRHGVQAFSDGALMHWVRSGDAPDCAQRAVRVRLTERWTAPELPVRGADVLARGVKAGPEVGQIVAALETWWIAEGFPSDPKKIADKLDELVRG